MIFFDPYATCHPFITNIHVCNVFVLLTITIFMNSLCEGNTQFNAKLLRIILRTQLGCFFKR